MREIVKILSVFPAHLHARIDCDLAQFRLVAARRSVKRTIFAIFVQNSSKLDMLLTYISEFTPENLKILCVISAENSFLHHQNYTTTIQRGIWWRSQPVRYVLKYSQPKTICERINVQNTPVLIYNARYAQKYFITLSHSETIKNLCTGMAVRGHGCVINVTNDFQRGTNCRVTKSMFI